MSATYKSPHNTLELSDNDLLWLGRMCYGEGGIRCSTAHAAVMIFAMINRYLLHPGRQHWSTFLYMLRAFSQPINPRWMRGGDLAEKNKNKDSCSKSRLDRREYICQMPWDKIPLSIICAVEAAKNGSLDECLPELKIKKTRLSNWAATSTWMKIRYPHGVNIDGNWFLEDKELSEGGVWFLKPKKLSEGEIAVITNKEEIEDPFIRMRNYYREELKEANIHLDEQTSNAIEIALAAVAKEIARLFTP